jgi:hypothetical protein
MAEKQEIDSSLYSREQATQTTRAVCYLDPQISLKFSNLEQFLSKKFALQVVSIKGRLDQRNFLQQIENITHQDLFIFFLSIAHGEQINELYGKWKAMNSKNAKSLFIILDRSVPSFRSNTNSLSCQRYQEMNQDQSTEIMLMGKDQFNADNFTQTIAQLMDS